MDEPTLSDIKDLQKQMLEEQEAQQQELDTLKKFFEHSIDWFIVVDTNGIIQYSNPRCESLLGYNKDEVIGKSFKNFVYPEDLKSTLEEFAAMITLKRPAVVFCNRYVTKQGEVIHLEWNASPPTLGKCYATARKIS